MLSLIGWLILVLVVVSEGGLVVVSVDWGLDEILLFSIGFVEIDVRLWLVVGWCGDLVD